MNMNFETGTPIPLGATLYSHGINFAIYLKDVSNLSIIIEHEDETVVFTLNSLLNKTGDIWHVFLDLKTDNLKIKYSYRFEKNNSTSYILDPYAKELQTPFNWKEPRSYPPKAVVSRENFSWENITTPKIALNDLIIYEMHVRGFTIDKSSQVIQPGTFTGIIEKIPFLKNLGINVIELMPIHEFNENEYQIFNPNNTHNLSQYWGYSSVNFFSLMNRYANESALKEFKNLVKELHLAGIKIILDVVFNHTSEGNKNGPSYSYKLIDNQSYYLLDHENNYLNYSGCGNTFNTNHPIASKLIIDSLRYWVVETHVDGFRFDLASIFNRDMKGNITDNSAILEAISNDPILSETLLIAEPWDATGFYQVGNFYSKNKRWQEWNGQYRDIVKSFIKGDPLNKGKFATCLSGSQNLYYNRSPLSSVNFITSHDGFSLYDLVSYNEKHNLENGENNRDGENNNLSWNCGVEGSTDNPEIINLRQRQMKNFNVALLISQGIPMLSMGDEYCHTRNGDNNAWCQDNKLNWYDWDKLNDQAGFFRFYKKMIHFRKEHPEFRKGNFLSDNDVSWFGKDGLKINWDEEMHFIGMIFLNENGNDIYCAFNTEDNDVSVKLPKLDSGKKWMLLVNTANKAPLDFYEENLPIIHEYQLIMKSYSAIILI